MLQAENHPRHMGADAAIGCHAQGRVVVAHQRAGLVPGAGGASAVNVVPLQSPGIVLDVAAVALGGPLTVASLTGQARVIRFGRVVGGRDRRYFQWRAAELGIEPVAVVADADVPERGAVTGADARGTLPEGDGV